MTVVADCWGATPRTSASPVAMRAMRRWWCGWPGRWWPVSSCWISRSRCARSRWQAFGGTRRPPSWSANRFRSVWTCPARTRICCRPSCRLCTISSLCYLQPNVHGVWVNVAWRLRGLNGPAGSYGCLRWSRRFFFYYFGLILRVKCYKLYINHLLCGITSRVLKTWKFYQHGHLLMIQT